MTSSPGGGRVPPIDPPIPFGKCAWTGATGRSYSGTLVPPRTDGTPAMTGLEQPRRSETGHRSRPADSPHAGTNPIPGDASRRNEPNFRSHSTPERTQWPAQDRPPERTQFRGRSRKVLLVKDFKARAVRLADQPAPERSQFARPASNGALRDPSDHPWHYPSLWRQLSVANGSIGKNWSNTKNSASSRSQSISWASQKGAWAHVGSEAHSRSRCRRASARSPFRAWAMARNARSIGVPCPPSAAMPSPSRAMASSRRPARRYRPPSAVE